MNKPTMARAAFNALVRHRIRIVMAVIGINHKQLAKDAKLSYATLNNVMNSPFFEPKMKHVYQIAQALDFDAMALLGSKTWFVKHLQKSVLASA